MNSHGNSGSETPDVGDPRPGVRWRAVIVKLLVLGAVLAAFGYVFAEYRDEISLERIARRESQFREFRRAHPIGVFAVAFAVYVAITGLSIPGATVLTVAYGWFFGFWRAVIVVSFGSACGATVAFLLSRYLFRDLVQRKFGDRLAKVNAALEREGAFYLFTLRLVPHVPFFVVNAVMGVTPMRVWTFWWVSQVGMLAGTCVYVAAGASIGSAGELAETGLIGILNWKTVTAFTLLGLFPLVIRKAMPRFRPRASEQSGDSELS